MPLPPVHMLTPPTATSGTEGRATMGGIRLGDEAPDVTAETTEGSIDFHEWKSGKWAVLFSHPADFTPVCTTELGRTAALKDEFAKRNPKAIPLSGAPVDSHNEWASDIAEVGGPKLNFPIIGASDRKV